ncbi:hypothetical protein C7S16_5023 [Burkholderia thailandensis]|uniref:Uncharacterized protein n=1 Tax=Burkholderia thailandensis TaxID=57975 RepID=A0AAW9CRL3_BURTH|nr:hypothetical protein [Burkholderia thailandensis]MDW9253244.1 hypothetical protein [Burkholderia thailandensis]
MDQHIRVKNGVKYFSKIRSIACFVVTGINPASTKAYRGVHYFERLAGFSRAENNRK